MSNTSSVTPYNADGTGQLATALGVAAVSACAALVTWLSEEDAADRALTERRAAEERQERIAGVPMTSVPTATGRPLTTVSLNLRSSESIVRSAQKLGYHVERPQYSSSSAPLAAYAPVFLKNADGARLAVLHNSAGRVEIATVGNTARTTNLVRQHSLDQTTALMASLGMQVQTATVANGEAQVFGREQGVGKRDGKAAVKVQIRANGQLDVDVDCVQGRRCERIVNDLAAAVGGTATKVTKKTAYFEEPGEPTKTQVKV